MASPTTSGASMSVCPRCRRHWSCEQPHTLLALSACAAAGQPCWSPPSPAPWPLSLPPRLRLARLSAATVAADAARAAFHSVSAVSCCVHTQFSQPELQQSSGPGSAGGMSEATSPPPDTQRVSGGCTASAAGACARVSVATGPLPLAQRTLGSPLDLCPASDGTQAARRSCTRSDMLSEQPPSARHGIKPLLKSYGALHPTADTTQAGTNARAKSHTGQEDIPLSTKAPTKIIKASCKESSKTEDYVLRSTVSS